MIKVDGHSNLYRDEESGAIINTDSTSYNQYVKSISKDKLRRKEIEDMRKDIDEIKSMLREVLQKPDLGN